MSLDENLNQPSLSGILKSGTDMLANQQIITFQQYSQYISPIDGMVYWVLIAGASFAAKGSLHFWTETRQEHDATYALNRVVFTSDAEVNDFNSISPVSIFIASMGEFYYTFSSNKNFFTQSDLYHYAGDAVYPQMLTQLVTSSSLIDNLVVSNSLPIWLSLAQGAGVLMFPSFLSPPNLVSPFITVHISDDDTKALQPVPSYVPMYQLMQLMQSGSYSGTFPGNAALANGYSMANGLPILPVNIVGYSHSQLVKDKVTLTFWGFSNKTVMAFYDYIINYMTNNNNLGLVGDPVIRDAKKTQSELRILGQKKTLVIDVSYYQAYAYNQSVQLVQQGVSKLLLGV